jgi:hypothetical protein
VNYKGIKFEAHKGWYKVDDQTAAQLGQVRQVSYNEDSAPAFDVMTEQEARAVTTAEKKAAEVKATVDNPIDAAIDRSNDLTTDDLRSSGEDDTPEGRKPRRGTRK